jgi:tRNA-specific 2-thiouridylase
MSGGVDSSVTAYLLKERGYEVEGVSFLLWEAKRDQSPSTCCSLHTMDEVYQTARHIGIPHSTIDLRNDFRAKVVEPFVHAYLSGLTPNPCILCNRYIKFPTLIKEADKRGAEYIATGHYARVESAKSMEHGAKSKNNSEHFLLKKGIDPKKDQSYVLYILHPDILKRLLLPLGNSRKDEVKKLAGELNLPAAGRSESQEICFVADRNYYEFIENLYPIEKKQGPIVDVKGKVIGTHKGVYGYTIGQRKGMGVSSPDPLYVVGIDVSQNTIYAGPRETAKKKEFFVENLNWLLPVCGEGEATSRPYRASVKVRSAMKDEPATIYLEANPPLPPFTKGEMGGLSGESVRVVYDELQWAPAPGQSAVFYAGDTVIGGGVIKKPV